jgi:hypothetical protein
MSFLAMTWPNATPRTAPLSILASVASLGCAALTSASAIASRTIGLDPFFASVSC